jgi:hypothetical protein
MATELFTLEDLKEKIGKAWLKLDYSIDGSMVRKYTEAVGDCNPRWQGRNAEVPPSLLATLGFECAISALLGLSAAVLHGSTELEALAPVRIGDIITVEASIAAIREREMSGVKMVFITLLKEYSNQRLEKVASCKQLAIVRQSGAQ